MTQLSVNSIHHPRPGRSNRDVFGFDPASNPYALVKAEAYTEADTKNSRERPTLIEKKAYPPMDDNESSTDTTNSITFSSL